MKRTWVLSLILLSVGMSIYTACADDNSILWRNIQIIVPPSMVYKIKTDIAIIAPSMENSDSFLVISGLSNLNSTKIINNLLGNSRVVHMQEIINTRIAKYDCVKVVYNNVEDEKINISYIFDKYNLRLVFSGPIQDYNKYEPTINSIHISD